MRALRGKSYKKNVYKFQASLPSALIEVEAHEIRNFSFIQFFQKLFVTYSNIEGTMATRSHQFVDNSKMSCHSNTFYSCFVASLFQIQPVKLSCSHFSPLTEPRARQERENHAHFRRINTSDINRAFGCIIQGWRYRGFHDKLNFFTFSAYAAELSDKYG